MKKQLIAVVVLVVAVVVGTTSCMHEFGLIPDSVVAAQDTGNGADSDDDKEPKDPEPESKPKFEQPKPEITEEGWIYPITFERGEGSVSLARQNDMLRVDLDIRLPYTAGDGRRDRGSSVDFILSADGVHGRHLFFFPNPVWLPNREGTLPAFRFEADYSKNNPAPKRKASSPTFVGEGNVRGWDRWTATIWVDLSLMLMPGNSPASLADKWFASMVLGNQASTVVYPNGMDMHNPSKTADKMLDFKLSELPEIEELDDSPMDTMPDIEKAMLDSMRGINAKLGIGDWKGTWKDTKAAVKKWPDALWALNIQWLLSNTARANKIEDIDQNSLKYQKDYLEGALGQSSVHLDYLYNQLELGTFEAASKHANSIFESDLCKGRAETDGYVRLQWAQRCLNWGQVEEATKQLEYIKEHPDLLKNTNFRIDYAFQTAALEIRKGDSSAAAAIYSKMLKDERKNLNVTQFNTIQQSLQFQKQGAEQWEDELKYRKEDADKTNPRLVVETDKGKIVIELFEDDAPNTTAGLVKLAKEEFYDGLNFHRVIPDFMAQGGCPNGDGTGSPGWRLKSEIGRRNHFRGTVAMARSGDPNSQGSQFYICVSNSSNVLNLSGNYVVVGRVIEGMDVADQLRIGDKIKTVRAENLRDHDYKPETIKE